MKGTLHRNRMYTKPSSWIDVDNVFHKYRLKWVLWWPLNTTVPIYSLLILIKNQTGCYISNLFEWSFLLLNVESLSYNPTKTIFETVILVAVLRVQVHALRPTNVNTNISCWGIDVPSKTGTNCNTWTGYCNIVYLMTRAPRAVIRYKEVIRSKGP